MMVMCINNKLNNNSFNIETGKKYIVYSIIMWGKTLDYLIIDEGLKNPSWYPAQLFKVTNPLLPFMWFFTFDKYKNYKGEECEKVIYGYKEMIFDSEHYISVIEEKPEALSIFFKRKKQIDEYDDLCKMSIAPEMKY